MQLIATGEQAQEARFAMEPGRSYIFGRDADCDCPIAWERFLSRRHFTVTAKMGEVSITRDEAAANPVFYRGEPVEQARLREGEAIVIGQTVFRLQSDPSTATFPRSPLQEVTFGPGELRQVRFADPDRRIEVLSRLPDVIWGARSEPELNRELVSLLLGGVVGAEGAAIVWLDRTSEQDSEEGRGSRKPTVRYWQRRRETAGPLQTSSRLIREVLSDGERSILHIWDRSGDQTHEYTASAELDWAFCVPVESDADGAWGLYVAGSLGDRAADGAATPSRAQQALHADVRFAEIVAEIIQSVRRVNRLEGRLSVLRQFLSPPILDAIEHTGGTVDSGLLEPRECDVTVLFCDLRGFSQRAEESSDDLAGLLDRVSRALQIMTRKVLDFGGVTGEFLGDATLGFWGWPFGSPESPLDACRAALAIRAAFAELRNRTDDVLGDFRVGIGIAHGRAMAGRIATSERVSVTVFGPVVNLAARLETMTKQLRVPILLDEATAKMARDGFSRTEVRVRKLAKVQPAGIETPLLVSELLPPAGGAGELSDEDIEIYERGVERFIAGDWEAAFRDLHSMPPADRAQDFLLPWITQHDRRAPLDWDGVVRLSEK